MVYTREERVFILEYYFASAAFVAVCEAFRNTCPDKEVPIMTPIHRLITKFRKRIVGPLVSWETVNAGRCQNLLIHLTSAFETNERDCCIHYDEATTHSVKTTTLLHEFFGERIVGCGHWPTRSPDLTPPHFLLWGFFKEKVYSNNS
jgi:hypothetical protein